MEEARAFQLWSPRNGLALTIPVVGYLGLRYERPILVAMAAVGFALLLAMFALGAYQVSRLAVRRKLPGGAFEDEAVAVELLVVNHGWLPLELVEVGDRFSPADYAFKRIVIADGLAARSAARVTYGAVCSKRRGRYEVGPARVRVTDPLGLFDHERLLPVHDEFLVYPATFPMPHVQMGGTSPRQAARLVSERHTGHSPSFHGTREFRTGDSPRAIHWPSSARRGRLVVAEYDREVARRLTIFVDLDERQRAGVGQRSVCELAVRVAASLARHALDARSLVEVVLADKREQLVRAGAGRRQLLRVLAALVDVRQDGVVPLGVTLERQLPRLPPGASIAIVTTSAGMVDDEAAAELMARCRAVRRGRFRRPMVVLLDHASFVQLRAPVEAAQKAIAAERAAALTRAGAHVYLLRADQPVALQFADPWEPPQPGEVEAPPELPAGATA